MTDHRARALNALGYIPDSDSDMRHGALASEATAHALLYVGDQIAALVEGQKLGNLIALGNPFESMLVAESSETAVIAHAALRIHDIVKPTENGDTNQ